MEIQNGVPPVTPPAASESVIPQTPNNGEQVVPPQVPATPPVGSQTPPENLYAALAEERRLRKELEDKLNNLNTTVPSEDEVFSDEGKLLAGKISTLESELSALKTESTRKDVLLTYPVLKDKWTEFETFRLLPENKGMNMRTAAKAFLVENGLTDPVRIGLEQPTGGSRTPPTSDMTTEDIKRLRENDPAQYRKLLQEGKIKFS